MSWIELHEEVRDHPKIKRLAKDMGVSKAEARGWVIGLWLWAATYAECGVLTGMDAEEVADACDYEGDEQSKLLGALIDRQLIDRNGDELKIHDWEKHGLRLLESNRERQKKFRERVDRESERRESEPELPVMDVTLQKRHANVDVTPTIPNHTIPNQKETAEDTRKAERPSAAAPEVRKPETQPPKRDTMALVTKLVQEHKVQDFSWLEGMLLHEWGREGRVGCAVNETLRVLGKEHGIDRLKYAIHEAARHGKKSLAYVEAILVPKEKESAVDTTKACRECGLRWDPLEEAKVTGSSLCPVCYPVRRAL